jgi:methenyltetrahydromethanopterin cyclohydrolase
MLKTLSVNRLAWKILEKLCANAEFYGVKVEKTSSGTTIVDAGINAKGGFQAGKLVTEICMGGCGKAQIINKQYGNAEFPSIFVHTDYPTIATLGSQFAGWQIKEGDYFAIGSGPARALALKPKEIYEEIGYKDDFYKGIIVLETDKPPPIQL